MKSVPVKAFTTTPKVITTATLLKESLLFMPQGGFDLATQRGRLRVMDAIDNIKDETIQLEDADYSTAVQAVQAVRWVSLEKHQVQFAEQFGL